MKPNTSNLVERVESLATRAKEARKLLSKLERAKHKAADLADQVKAINTDGLPDNSPVLKLKDHIEEKRIKADEEANRIAEEIALMADGVLGDYAREALQAFEGTSGAGIASYEEYPAILALHDLVCDPARLPDVSRNYMAGSYEVNLPT